MRRLVAGIAVAGAMMLSTATVALADYAAIAAGPYDYGWVMGGYRTMDAARNAAIARCRNNGGGSCSVSTAEDSSWFFGVGYCDGVPYTAATPQGSSRLLDIIRIKGAADGNRRCSLEDWF